MWLKEIGKSVTFPPLPPCHCSGVKTLVGSHIFPTPPLPGRHGLLLAGGGCTQPIRMEETYTLTMMNRPGLWYVTNNFWLFFTYLMFSYRNIHFIRNAWRQKDSQDANWGILTVVTQLLHNNYLSFRQLKCGESHMTYLARNTVKNPFLDITAATFKRKKEILNFVFYQRKGKLPKSINNSLVTFRIRFKFKFVHIQY